uniref:Ig-like domain-containing protein n=1 Tax=Sinocyclocheilus grahami TaxID=75366 RepID=A0A672MVF1_SINGR
TGIHCFCFLHTGISDVSKVPSVLMAVKGSSVQLNCTQKGFLFVQTYWYQQRPGQTMTLIVFTNTYTQPEYGDFDPYFSVIKTVPESGSLTVNNLATYFCSMSEYTVYQTLGIAVQKNRCLKIRSKH